ncbi:MAG: 16S rRNA processing protein RimM [Rhodospirillales bacterium]|nr:16S rRNA processing protein RimM [Rhodospirillales bacterium]
MAANCSTKRWGDTRVCIGEITAAHGVRGELCVRSFAAEPADFVAYGPLETETGDRLLHLRIVGQKKAGFIVRAAGIEDRTLAEALRGEKLFVRRARLPALSADEFYHADLVGLAAEVDDAAANGGVQVHGRVAAVHDFGAGPILEITFDDGPSMLVPFNREAVPVVDIDAGCIVVAALPGLTSPDPASLEQDVPSPDESDEPLEPEGERASC